MKREKGINVNIKGITAIILLLIVILTIISKTGMSNKIDVAKLQVEENSIQTIVGAERATVTSRYNIDRKEENSKENLSQETTEFSSEELLKEYVEYAHTKKVEPNDIGIAIEDVKISVDMDITKRTGLSKENFKELVRNVRADTSGFFYDNADLIYDLCEKYELNEIFFCGLISAESGWDIASNHRRTYNYISLMRSGGLIQFSSVEDGLESAARTLHNNYLSEGGSFYYGKTLSAMQTRFCPNSSTWVGLVYGRMKQMI